MIKIEKMLFYVVKYILNQAGRRDWSELRPENYGSPKFYTCLIIFLE